MGLNAVVVVLVAVCIYTLGRAFMRSSIVRQVEHTGGSLPTWIAAGLLAAILLSRAGRVDDSPGGLLILVQLMLLGLLLLWIAFSTLRR